MKKTEIKTQLRGACSVCGRVQAVRGGIVAEHGYHKKDGWKFTGSCSGSNRPHFGTEKGRDFAAGFVVTLRDMAGKPGNEKKAGAFLAFADELEKRVANWKPAEPVEVPVEIVEKPVHLAGKVYGHSAAVCCASAMGAMRFRGLTTADEEKVTCSRCLKAIERRKAIRQ